MEVEKNMFEVTPVVAQADVRITPIDWHVHDETDLAQFTGNIFVDLQYTDRIIQVGEEES